MSEKNTPNNKGKGQTPPASKTNPQTPELKPKNPAAQASNSTSGNSAENKPINSVTPPKTSETPSKNTESKPTSPKDPIIPEPKPKSAESKTNISADSLIPEPKPAEKKVDNKTSLPPTPPSAGKNSGGNPPKSPEKKSGNGLSLLALLIALAAAGISGYNFLQNQQHQNIDLAPLEKNVSAAENQALAAENRANEISKTVEALQSHVANQAQGLDKAEVSQLIASALSDYSKNQTPPQAANATGLSREEVEQMITTALASQQAGAPSAELNELLNNIRQSGEEAKAALAQLNTRSNEIENKLNTQSQNIAQQLNAQAQQLGGNLSNAVQTQANPQPLIAALTLADIALQNGNYATANQYLSSAENAFSEGHLGETALATYQSKVSELKTAVSKLAGQGNPIAEIDNIINTLPAWTFKTTHHAQQTETPKVDASQNTSIAQTTENIGTRILHRTFTVVHNDDAGLTWINTHPDLQVLIRENVRLDLAFARNALQLHDADSYKRTIDNLRPRIQQYFSENDDNVKNALNTLQVLEKRENTPLPDIKTLINTIQQTAAKE